MKHFRYKVINENGRYVSGRMSAENPSDLATILRSTGFTLDIHVPLQIFDDTAK